MALVTKTFKISRGNGVREVETFIDREIGKDLSLIKGLNAISLTENTTQLTVTYEKFPNHVIDISNPIPGMIVASGSLPDGIVLQYASQFRPSTFSGTSQVQFNDSGIAPEDIYIEADGTDNIVTIDVSNYYGAFSGIQNLTVDSTVKRLDGSSQLYSVLSGFTVTTTAAPFVGYETTYTAKQVRGSVGVRYQILDTSVASADKALAQILANEKELLIFTTAKKSDSQTELFMIVVSKPEPRVISSSPPLGANHPASAPFGNIYLTFSHSLNRQQLESQDGVFSVVKQPGTTVDITKEYITLLDDDRTVVIAINNFYSDQSFTTGFISLILKSGLISSAGVKSTKSYLLP